MEEEIGFSIIPERRIDNSTLIRTRTQSWNIFYINIADVIPITKETKKKYFPSKQEAP